MAAQTTPFQVDLTDLSGGAFSADQVTFETSAGPTTLTAAPFMFDLSVAGEASLTIEKKGHHTFRFELNVIDSGKDFTVTINKKLMLDAPRMLTLVKLASSAKAQGPGVTNLRLESVLRANFCSSPDSTIRRITAAECSFIFWRLSACTTC